MILEWITFVELDLLLLKLCIGFFFLFCMTGCAENIGFISDFFLGTLIGTTALIYSIDIEILRGGDILLSEAHHH